MASATNTDYATGVPFDEWIAANRPHDPRLFDDTCISSSAQSFLPKLHELFVADYEERKDLPIRVIGEHDNGYQKVPVFSIFFPGVVEIRICHKYPAVSFGWFASVKSKQPIDIDFGDLFDREEPTDFEDFGDGWHLPQFGVDDQEFSLEVHGEHELHTFCWLLTRELGINGTHR